MNIDNNMNLNTADCIRSVSDFGATHVHNICTGVISEVPWGSADWALALLIGLFVCGITSLFAAMAISIWRD